MYRTILCLMHSFIALRMSITIRAILSLEPLIVCIFLKIDVSSVAKLFFLLLGVNRFLPRILMFNTCFNC